MIVINRMVADRSESDVQIKLMAERRLFLKRRWRATAEDGTEFGFDLDSRLNNGAVILQTEVADYVIWQEPEIVHEIPFESAGQSALIGWKIGNLHLPVQILAASILVQQDLAVTQLCEREGWLATEVRVVFNPLRVTPHAS